MNISRYYVTEGRWACKFRPTGMVDESTGKRQCFSSHVKLCGSKDIIPFNMNNVPAARLVANRIAEFLCDGHPIKGKPIRLLALGYKCYAIGHPTEDRWICLGDTSAVIRSEEQVLEYLKDQ